MNDAFVNMDNTKGDHREKYRARIEKIQGDGVCPFCPEHLARYHTNPILREGNFWLMTDNLYPYRGAKHHILLIYRKHIERILDMAPEAWTELGDFVQSEIKKRGIAGGTCYMRFGDTSYTGASVTHLHANIIAPDVENPDREPIMARVG